MDFVRHAGTLRDSTWLQMDFLTKTFTKKIGKTSWRLQRDKKLEYTLALAKKIGIFIGRTTAAKQVQKSVRILALYPKTLITQIR